MTTGNRAGGEEGLTLIELLVASALMVVAFGMFTTALAVSQRTQIRDTEYSAANDGVHLAMAEIDRQVRSGYVIQQPTLYSGTIDGVRIFTLGSGQAKCVMWVVASAPSGSTQALYTKSWAASDSPPSSFQAASWRLVADGIVGADAATFQVMTPYSSLFPALEMVLKLNFSSTRAAQEIEVRSQFVSRNVPRTSDPYSGAGTSTTGGACV